MMLMLLCSPEALLVNLDLLIEESLLGSKIFTVVVEKGLNECLQQENSGTGKNSLLENLSSLQGGWAGSHLKVPCSPNYAMTTISIN